MHWNLILESNIIIVDLTYEKLRNTNDIAWKTRSSQRGNVDCVLNYPNYAKLTSGICLHIVFRWIWIFTSGDIIELYQSSVTTIDKL